MWHVCAEIYEFGVLAEVQVHDVSVFSELPPVLFDGGPVPDICLRGSQRKSGEREGAYTHVSRGIDCPQILPVAREAHPALRICELDEKKQIERLLLRSCRRRSSGEFSCP